MFQSKTLARLLSAAVMAVLAAALLAPAAQAQEPAPGYTQFKGCPTPAQSSFVEVCVRSDVLDGHLQMGSKDVPIENPLVITGGVNSELEGFTANSFGGLSKVKQKVPGGVLGLTGLTWLLEFFGSDALTLYATTELAGAPSEFAFSSVTFPIKVHLETPSNVLGSNCYIGSTASPITLHLITGTTSPPGPNKPITGKESEVAVDPELEIIKLSGGEYVDNSFAAPGASGCVLKLFGFIPISLNGFVNSQSGLPSAAGKNETRQEFTLELASQSKVYP
ncbi:MAG: hypothetical protein WA687_12560 [Solirubrobacterales bacterium]